MLRKKYNKKTRKKTYLLGVLFIAGVLTSCTQRQKADGEQGNKESLVLETAAIADQGTEDTTITTELIQSESTAHSAKSTQSETEAKTLKEQFGEACMKWTIRGKTYVHWICRSKKETGMSCTSVNFSEEELERISARTLGMDEFDGAVFEKTVLGMAVLPDGDIKFRLAGGETKTWKNLHLDPPRHVATVTDCFQGKIRCAACGNTYHRVNGAGKWVYWYCIGKKRKNVECHNPNCTDYKLRQVSAHMMGLEEFDEAEFEKQIEEITAFPDGSLEFNFYGGRKERWQRA